MTEKINFPWNVGKGTQAERTLALIYNAMDNPNVVTRHICRQILAEKISRLLSHEENSKR